MSSWASIIVSLISSTAVLVGALVAITRFSTKMSVTIENLSAAIDKLSGRMDEVDRAGRSGAIDSATLIYRLTQVETNTRGLEGLRSQYDTSSATANAERVHMQQCLDRHSLVLENLQAQIGHLVSGRADRILEVGSRR